MAEEILRFFDVLFGILKDRPDLFVTAALLMAYLFERAERREMTSKNLELVEKMHDQNKDTNELLGQIKFLLELLTKGRN